MGELGFKIGEHESGRPSYDPKDMLKLYIYGYFNKVRSSRKLKRKTKINIEVIWLLNKLSQDHKTISRFRKDNTKALKNTFRAFVKVCLKLNSYKK
ncbi:MAG: transposase [Lachnospirales bacterium]